MFPHPRGGACRRYSAAGILLLLPNIVALLPSGCGRALADVRGSAPGAVWEGGRRGMMNLCSRCGEGQPAMHASSFQHACVEEELFGEDIWYRTYLDHQRRW